MKIEIAKLLIYSLLIVIISKYVLVYLLRRIAETLNLEARVVGKISGFATSIPEILTVSFSTATGLVGASIFNILSSNIINTIQYIFSIIINKNRKILKNTAIKIDVFLSILTILIPIILIALNIEMEIFLVPLFLTFLIAFNIINRNMHRKYLKKFEIQIEEKRENGKTKNKKRKTTFYGIGLLIIGFVLFLIGDKLSIVLENLCNVFSTPEWVIGIMLGFITSLPELITFFEAQRHHAKKENEELGVIEATNNLLSSNMTCLFIVQSIGILIYAMIY